MPVKLLIPSRVSLEPDRYGSVHLPAIGIEPLSPDVFLAEVRVEANDDQGADPFADQVTRAYPTRRLSEPTPLKRPVSINPTDRPSNVPADVRCRVTVRAFYHDRDPRRTPPPELHELRAETVITVSRPSPPPPTTAPATSAGEVVREVVPAELELVVGEATEFSVITTGANVRPEVQLVEPAVVERPLAAAIERAFSEPPSPQVRGDGTVEWTYLVRFRDLPRAARQSLARLGRSPVRLRSRVGTSHHTHAVRFRDPLDAHGGWLTIDWGYSYTLSVLYDDDRVPVMVGLHAEQNRRLKELVRDWLDRARDGLPGVTDDEWAGFLDRHADAPKNGRLGLRERFDRADAKGLHELVFKLEWAAENEPNDALRRAVRRRLTAIYHKVFRTPPLEANKILAMELDPVRHVKGASAPARPLASEVQVVAVKPTLVVAMGEEVKRNRLAAIEQNRPAREIRGQYEPNPKRWLYMKPTEQVEVFCDGEFHRVAAEDLVRATLTRIVDLSNQARAANPERYPDQKPFGHLVLTYPNTLTPSSRRMYRKAASTLSPHIRVVSTDLDEAVTALLYQVFIELGVASEIGLEAFKARCRRDGDAWYLNAAVADIGGGTFDLALIRFVVRQVDPFDPGEDRGMGGRFYVIEPKLLASSGHEHLGGERITLRLYKLVKALLADAVLAADRTRPTRSPALRRELAQFHPRFLDPVTQEYVPGSLPAAVSRMGDESNSNEEYRDALADVERVIPTAWVNTASDAGPRLALFHELKSFAEAAKIALGGVDPDRPAPLEHPFPLETLEACCRQLGKMGVEVDAASLPSLAVTADHLDVGQAWPLEEAAAITARLLASRLPTAANGTDREPLDWLILSGQTSKLRYASAAFRSALSGHDWFTWNRERITVDAAFTKPAAVGASWIVKRQRKGFRAGGLRELLRKGVSEVDIRLDQLFYYLPSSFMLDVGNPAAQPVTLIPHGSRLLRLDAEELGKVRSEWREPSLTMNILRQDYDGGEKRPWARFAADELCQQMGIKSQEFGPPVCVQVEIDHRQELELLFCRGNRPHYALPADLEEVRLPATGVRPAADGRPPALTCDVAVDVDAAHPGAERVVFRAGELSEQFHLPDGSVRGGRVEALDPRADDTALCFWSRLPDGSGWVKVGQLAAPVNDSDYPWRLSVSVDETGAIRLHAGEVPYWESDDPAVLRDRPGCVVRWLPQAPTAHPEVSREPYSGVH